MSNNNRRSSERVAFIIEYLESHYETDGPDNCAVFLKEPIRYILSRAGMIGLKKPKPLLPKKETEIERLRRINSELKIELLKSSKKVTDRDKTILLLKSRENNLLNKIDKIREEQKVW